MTRIPLRTGEIHIWQATLAGSKEYVAEMRSLLSADEIQRADRFIFEKDRNRFTVARAILRLILENYGEVSARNLKFEYSPAGKPSLASPSSLDFNLSHSGDLAVYAIRTGTSIGIDLEKINPEIEYQELAARFFSNQENAALDSIPVQFRIEAFFRCWTRKEAYVKALGEGLSLPFDQFSVSFIPGDFPCVIGKPEWVVHDLSIHPEYAAALVAATPVMKLEVFNFSGSISKGERSVSGTIDK